MLAAFRESDPELTGRIPTVLLRLIVSHVNEALTDEELDEMENQIDPEQVGEVPYENLDILERIHSYID